MIKTRIALYGLVFMMGTVFLLAHYDTATASNYTRVGSDALSSNAQPIVDFKSAEEFLEYKNQLIASNSEFAEPIRISAGETGNVSNTVTFRSGDLIFVAWEGDLNNKSDIFASISFDNARSFGPPFLLSVNNTGDAIKPTVTIVNGSLYAAWEQHENNVSNVASSSSMDNGHSFITYLQTNATATGPVFNATDPRFSAPALTLETINNMSYVTNEGYPFLYWLQQTENSTDEWGHGRPW
ncbi:MAG: hypothetical protein AB7U98_07865 [Candidatus Nitrosocosmicus sp.]|jgi:hypothetical protein